MLAYQAIRIEEILTKKGPIDYDLLVTIKKEDFNYFNRTDFINIIGSEDIELCK